MRSTFFASAAFAAVASAQGSSSVNAFPQTSLLAQTNSLGVVTGMFPVATQQPGQPAAVTTQPAVVTSQPLPDNIPAVGSGVQTLLLPGTGSMFNSTRTVVVSANNSTTIVVQTSPAASASGSGGSGAVTTGPNASRSAGASGASGSSGPKSSAGAAANVKVAGSVLGLGAFVAALL